MVKSARRRRSLPNSVLVFRVKLLDVAPVPGERVIGITAGVARDRVSSPRYAW
jgi:hypothetical protein